MDCFNLNISELGDKNFIFPVIGLCGLCMTYFGNKFVRPTIFSLGTILSMGSSYKLTHLIMNRFDYSNCLVKCGISVVSGFSGGYLALKLYRITYFVLGFVCGGSAGFLLHEIAFYKYKLGMIYNYDTVFWLSIGIPGILSGIISMNKEEKLSIMTTAFVGPLLLLYGINQFFGFYNLNVFIPGYVFLAITGLFIQCETYKSNNNEITYVGNK